MAKMQLNSKFYRYVFVDGKECREELRIVGFCNEKNVKVEKSIVFEDSTVKSNNVIEKINTDKLDDFTLLNPDGFIIISQVTIGNNADDILITLCRKNDINNGVDTPFVVCRQGAIDLFAKQLSPGNVDYAGISISKETCPAGVNFYNYLACDEIKKNCIFSYYIGDDINTLLSLNKKFIDSCDEILSKMLKDHCMYLVNNNSYLYDGAYKNKTEVDGYCNSVYKLLELNNFEYDLYRAFGIYPTILPPEDFSDNVLSVRAIKMLSDFLTQQVYKTLVLPYTKDIDLSKVDRKYVLMSDNTGQVYIVAYTILFGAYRANVETRFDADNIEKLRKSLPSSVSIQSAYDYIKFNKDKYQ